VREAIVIKGAQDSIVFRTSVGAGWEEPKVGNIVAEGVQGQLAAAAGIPEAVVRDAKILGVSLTADASLEEMRSAYFARTSGRVHTATPEQIETARQLAGQLLTSAPLGPRQRQIREPGGSYFAFDVYGPGHGRQFNEVYVIQHEGDLTLKSGFFTYPPGRPSQPDGVLRHDFTDIYGPGFPLPK
jgi:hypothetical protein